MPRGVYQHHPHQGFKKGISSWSIGLTARTDKRIENKSGKNHYRWIEDRKIINKGERNNPEYKQWVRKIKNRDDWKCKIKSNDCKGYCIVHHILPWRDYPNERYNINNGITLCQAHHPRKRAEEKLLAPTFQELISQVN